VVVAEGVQISMVSTVSVAASAAAAGVPLPQPSIAALVSSQNSTNAPSRVLLLLNMVTDSDLLVDDEYPPISNFPVLFLLPLLCIRLVDFVRYEDIVEDVREECAKLGTVKSVAIPRPKDGLNGVGKIFVEFEKVEDCTSAHATLGCRKFAGRSVIAVYYDEALYASRVF